MIGCSTFNRRFILFTPFSGNQRLDRTPLDWSQRFKIALGVAKALRYLHYECGKQKIAHGNIKSSNILLDENHRPLVADFGLSLILSPTAAASRVAGYHAPGHADMKRISQPSDVYSFGVVSFCASFIAHPLIQFMISKRISTWRRTIHLIRNW